MSAFKAAVENKDLDAMRAALAPDVTFSSPAVFKPYEGREMTMGLLGFVVRVFEDFEYVFEVTEGNREVLGFRARVGEKALEGVDLLELGDDGLVTSLTVMIRPLSGLLAVRDAMGALLAKAG